MRPKRKFMTIADFVQEAKQKKTAKVKSTASSSSELNDEKIKKIKEVCKHPIVTKFQVTYSFDIIIVH